MRGRTGHEVRELGLLGLGLLVWAGSEYLRVRRSPSYELEQGAQRALNRLDRRARGVLFWGEERAPLAQRISDAGAYLVAPLVCALTLAEPKKRTLHDLVSIGRTIFLTGLVNQLVKVVAPRERPFALEKERVRGHDRYGSFFSSHASATAAMAGATTARLALRGRAVERALPLWGLALGVGYLRIASDRHFLTDVVAGIFFGGAAGAVLARRFLP